MRFSSRECKSRNSHQRVCMLRHVHMFAAIIFACRLFRWSDLRHLTESESKFHAHLAYAFPHTSSPNTSHMHVRVRHGDVDLLRSFWAPDHSVYVLIKGSTLYTKFPGGVIAFCVCAQEEVIKKESLHKTTT